MRVARATGFQWLTAGVAAAHHGEMTNSVEGPLDLSPKTLMQDREHYRVNSGAGRLGDRLRGRVPRLPAETRPRLDQPEQGRRTHRKDSSRNTK